MRVVFALLVSLLAHPVLACQPGEACSVPTGLYRVATPAHWDGHSALPVMVFFPGYHTTASDTIADVDVHDAASELGVLLVALEPGGGRWDLPPFGEPRRDEAGYVASVLDEVARTYPLDRRHVLAAGFSIGASMVWYFACSAPPAVAGWFTAYAAFEGTFWAPQPSTCPGPPVSLVHLHGTADTVFPLHGRALRNGLMHQGDSPEAVAMLRRHDACPAARHRKAEVKMSDGALMQCEFDDACAGGTRVRFCQHGGTHMIEASWIRAAWDFVLTAPGLPPAGLPPAGLPPAGLPLQNHRG